MNTIHMGGRPIGPGAPCYIIAEAGVNHNGDVELAKQLVKAARECGADAVKFQTYITDELIVPDAPTPQYQKDNVSQSVSQHEILRDLELGFEAFSEIRSYADDNGIQFLSTPSDRQSADFLDRIGVPGFKIGSGEITNLPLLEHVAAMGKPVILSTGMSSLGQVEAGVLAMENTGNRSLALLHCVSDYPAAPESCNLRAMRTLAAAFGYPVGFSDHTLGIDITTAAAALGACVLEKHLTLNKSLPGPDHRASSEPNEFSAMVRAVRRVESAMGDGRKAPAPCEPDTAAVVRRTVVTLRAVTSGEVLGPSDVGLRRAGKGLGPDFLPFVLGRRATRDLEAHSVLAPGDFM